MNIDRLTNAYKTGTNIILKTPDEIIIVQSLQFRFQEIDNETEYETLIAGLKLGWKLRATKIRVLSDSELVINQINGEYVIKDMKISIYLGKVKKLILEFGEFLIK